MLPARAARLLFQLPRNCRTFCAIQPANQWGWSEMLANKANYILEVLAWQNTKDGHKKRPTNKPKMFVPDFIKKLERSRNKDPNVETHDIDDIKNILNKPRK